MEALDFINKEIEATKRSHKAFELDYELFHRESDNRDAEELKKKLIQLQQIKVELEAWEVCKHKMELYQEQHYSLAKETTTKISETMRIRIFVNDQNQVQTVIKALEVEE